MPYRDVASGCRILMHRFETLIDLKGLYGKKMQYRIGVIGATGYIGVPYRKEIREASQDAQIVALCARRRDRLEAAAAEDGATLVTDDWREVVNHPDVNLVLVLTPDALHIDPVLACAELGKHVLCEKPVGKDAQEALSMWQAAEQKKLASYVPYWTRYVPVFRRAKAIVEEGRLGEIKSVIYRWQNPRPVDMPFTWRDNAELSAAGSIADVGSHAYDTMRFILGQEAVRVLTHAQVIMPPKPDLGDVDLNEALEWGQQHKTQESESQRKGSVPDYAQIGFEFGDGAVGSILLSHASYLRKGFAPELELHGTLGSLSVDRIHGELKFADSPDPAKLLETIDDDGMCNRFENHVFPAFEKQLAGEGKGPHPDLFDGLQVQKFTDAAFASSQTGTWVDIPGENPN